MGIKIQLYYIVECDICPEVFEANEGGTQGFNTKAEAVQKLNSIRNNSDISVWVLTVR